MAGSNISNAQYDAKFSSDDASPVSKWTRGASERPLVNVQRTTAPIMRVPVERVGDVIYRELPEDRHGLVSPPNDTSHQLNAALSRETPSAAASRSGEPDADEIAEHAWRLTMERLFIEQERRGLAKWP